MADSVLGLGVDMVKVERIQRAVERWSDGFTRRVFTEGELSYCMGQKHPAMHLAARFGVKEAVMKAFGTGWTGGVRWTDVEVVREPSGRPGVVLGGRLKELARDMGVTKTLVSFSHDGGYAVAQAVITGEVVP
jgi:holo-[acyl-carrier protein] synthase